MFLKSNLRPATVGAGEQNVSHSRRNSSMAFDAGSDDVFGDLSGYSDRATPSPSAQPRKEKKQRSYKSSRFNLNIKSPKVFIPIIAAIVAIIAIIIIIIASGSGDIKYTNNSYLLYTDSSGAYHVVSNGEVIDYAFEGEVKLVEAVDRSFAYVYDEIESDSIKMFILKGKKLTPLLAGEPVQRIECEASLEPGVVYLDASGDNYMIYNEKDGEEQLARAVDYPDDFQISGDGKTVAYTVQSSKDANKRILCLYEGRNSEEISPVSSTPVAISNYGKYLYITRPVDGKDTSYNSLYVCDTKSKKYDIYQIEGSEGFKEILEMNVNGDEIIFAAEKPVTNNGGGDATEQVRGNKEIHSYLYRHKAKKDDSLVDLGKDYVTIANFDPEVAIHKNFKDVYLFARAEKTDTTSLDATDNKGATYYLNKKYEKSIIRSDYIGKFSPDVKYFYYIDNGTLYRLNLKDKQVNSEVIDTNVVDYIITKKGNVYTLRNNGNLNYYKTSSDNKERVFYQVDMISFYTNSNKLYFINNKEGPAIDVSKESTDYDKAKFGSSELASLPYFTTPDIKKCYAIVWNPVDGDYSVYFTSNGKRFKFLKKIDDCKSIIINGEEIDLQDYVINVEAN